MTRHCPIKNTFDGGQRTENAFECWTNVTDYAARPPCLYSFQPIQTIQT